MYVFASLFFLRGFLRTLAPLIARGIDDLLGTDTDAVFHVEDGAIDGDSVEKRGG